MSTPSTPFPGVTAELGPQYQQVAEALNRLHSIPANAWWNLHWKAEAFYSVPGVNGLLVDRAWEGLVQAALRAGRLIAIYRGSRYAVTLMEVHAKRLAPQLSQGERPPLPEDLPGLEKMALDGLVLVSKHVLSALAARDLIGEDFTQDHYDLLTGPWRQALGDLHPDDSWPPNKPRPPESLLEPEVLADLGPEGPRVQALLHLVPELTYEQVRELAEAHHTFATRGHTDSMMIVSFISDPVRKRASQNARGNAASLASQLAYTLLPRYLEDQQMFPPPLPWSMHKGPHSQLAMMISLPAQRAIAGLLFREQMKPGNKVHQIDYDCVTGPWRTVIGPIHPDDAVYVPNAKETSR